MKGDRDTLHARGILARYVTSRSLMRSLLSLSLSLSLLASGCPTGGDDDDAADDDDAGDDDDAVDDDDSTAADDDDVKQDDDDAVDDDDSGQPPCPTVTGQVDFDGAPPTGITPGPLAVGVFAPADIMDGLPAGEPLGGLEEASPTFPYTFELCAPPPGSAVFLAIFDVNDGVICTPFDLYGSTQVTVPAPGAPFDVGTVLLSNTVSPDGCRREDPPE
jgi:hypothetical protein